MTKFAVNPLAKMPGEAEHERHRAAMENAGIPPNARSEAAKLIGLAFTIGLLLGVPLGAVITASLIALF